MPEKPSKSKLIIVSILVDDVINDPYYFNVPAEVSSPEKILEHVLKKYHTDTGILEGFIDRNRIVLHWYPDKVDETAETLHQEALKRAKSKQFTAAIGLWEKAIARSDSCDVDYLYKIALVLFELKKYEESIQYLEKAVTVCPIHHKALLLLGINWIKQRKFNKAEISISASNRLNRSNTITYLNLGAIYSVKKQYNEAIEMFNAAIRLSPRESRAFLGLARIYSLINDIETSNNYFRKVIELAPNSKIAELAKRSIVVPETGKSASQKSGNREEFFSKGMGLYLYGDYAAASSQYKEYVNKHPSDDYGWYLLGESKLRSGNPTEAVDCFKRSIRLNSKRGIYYKALGVGLHYLGRAEETVEVLKRAIELGKRDALCYTLIGINLGRQKKIGDSIQNYDHTLTKYPNNPLAMYHMALALIQMDEKEKAGELISKIMSYEYLVPIKNLAKKLSKTLT